MMAVLSANVCMCVCVFPDGRSLTPKGLVLIKVFRYMKTLTVQNLPSTLPGDGEQAWGWLPGSLTTLTLSGELRRHNTADLYTTHSKLIDSVTTKCGNYSTQSH